MFPNTWFTQNNAKYVKRKRKNKIKIYRRFNFYHDIISHLHADDGIDEEEHSNEQADVGQSLEGLNEGPQEDADGVTLPQQFDQTSRSKQLQETHVERVDTLREVRRSVSRSVKRSEPKEDQTPYL